MPILVESSARAALRPLEADANAVDRTPGSSVKDFSPVVIIAAGGQA